MVECKTLLLGLQSKMRGSLTSVLAPVTHDTPGPAAGAYTRPLFSST